ncbi:Blp family class II bacteriocin [Paraliobacillus sp. JSM ZJ581]|uniref:Blp family class II bacteriocin n=1 Tax=Paraliobacillus sp. JSM ZJ581 TaxID=3342118 RepID=UPI0035A90C90
MENVDNLGKSNKGKLIEHNFQDINKDELTAIDGGFVITGSMVVAGVGCIAGGVATGYAIGTIIKKWF